MCGESPKYVAWKNGYKPDDIEKIPEDSILGLGCGNPFNSLTLRKGDTVLNLGSKAGIDVFLASKKVGSEGKVIGVDMVPEMIERSKNIASENNYTNVEFRLGEINSLPIEDGIIDVVIANNVVNLFLDKLKIFKEVYRILKKEGLFSVTDLVIDTKLSGNFHDDFDAWVRGIAGAIKKSEYIDHIEKSGFSEVKIISQKPFKTENYPKLQGKITCIQVQAKKSL